MTNVNYRIQASFLQSRRAPDHRPCASKADLINGVRRDRISRALAISDLISVGLKENVIFDPHIGIQAYVAFESKFSIYNLGSTLAAPM